MLFCLQALFFSYSHAASAVSKKIAGYSPAFAAALRIELEEELSRLDIREEFQLTKKPLQMDMPAFISLTQTG